MAADPRLDFRLSTRLARMAFADQAERDHASLKAAVRNCKINAVKDA
jgi:hypothetical protein